MSNLEHQECAWSKYVTEETITNPDDDYSGCLPLNLARHIQNCIKSGISPLSQDLAQRETLSL